MQFGCLTETRVKEKRAGKIISEVFQGWDNISNYEHHRLGRLWVVWGPMVRLTPVYKSNQLITCSVLMKGKGEEFFCSFVYALNGVEERKSMWEELKDHHDAPMIKHKKWMIMGDFNEILEGEVHSDYEDIPRVPPGMRDFQEVARYCSLTDMSYQGSKFTWRNKREDGLIYKKLDRVLVNEEWLHTSKAYCVFESGWCSDHLRCRIHWDVEEKKKIRPFKFTNSISKMEEFIPLMRDQWRGREALYHCTSAMFMLTKQLKALKQPLRMLSKIKMGDLSRRMREAFVDLCEKQKLTLERPVLETINEEIKAYDKWQRLAGLEEEFLKQRSKLHWLDVGDGNNKDFHSAIKIREVRNSIREIVRADGTIAKTDDDIKEEAYKFFAEFMTAQPQDFEGVTMEKLKEILRFQCSNEDCEKLEREVSKEKVKSALFKMPGDKFPGPDGFTSEFFKEACPVIGEDVTVAVQSFFQKGFLPKGVNSTILALIPKKRRQR